MNKVRITASMLILLLAMGDAPLAWAVPGMPPPAAGVSTAPVSSVREPMIEVSVDSLEISETNQNQIGILWGQFIQQGGQTGTSSQPVLQNNQLNFLESTVPALFNIGKFDRSAIGATLQAMIQNNQARILANPSLLTKSGFEANFLVGGEIPYPTVGQGGVGGVEFKKYGVSLKILPQLTPRSTIDAQINVSVSNPDNSVAIQLSGSSTPTPGLSSREAGSKVEVTDGETVVLAGIKQSRRSKTVTRVPFLSAIPLLGLLFRSTNESVVQTSLVFFVTFRLIRPT